jgi:aminopeptidase S
VQRLVAEVSGDGALPHLQALQRIADANGGNRASPGPGYAASVDYVVGVLRDAGYAVSTPT